MWDTSWGCWNFWTLVFYIIKSIYVVVCSVDALNVVLVFSSYAWRCVLVMKIFGVKLIFTSSLFCFDFHDLISRERNNRVYICFTCSAHVTIWYILVMDWLLVCGRKVFKNKMTYKYYNNFVCVWNSSRKLWAFSWNFGFIHA